jgi:hypothetical protein
MGNAPQHVIGLPDETADARECTGMNNSTRVFFFAAVPWRAAGRRHQCVSSKRLEVVECATRPERGDCSEGLQRWQSSQRAEPSRSGRQPLHRSADGEPAAPECHCVEGGALLQQRRDDEVSLTQGSPEPYTNVHDPVGRVGDAAVHVRARPIGAATLRRPEVIAALGVAGGAIPRVDDTSRRRGRPSRSGSARRRSQKYVTTELRPPGSSPDAHSADRSASIKGRGY